MKKIFLTITLFLSAHAIIYAQDTRSGPCAICETSLAKNTRDEFLKETRHVFDESLNTLFNYEYEYWLNYSSSSAHTESLDAAYKIFTLDFGSSNSQTEAKEIFNKQKSAYFYSRSISQNDMEMISQKMVNKVPYQTFLECVRATCGTGLFTSYSLSGDNIVVTCRWMINGGSPDQLTKLRNITIANAINVDYGFKTGDTLKPLNSISGLFRRLDPTQDVIISLDFENFPSQQIAIRKTINVNFNTPVGTIIISELDFGNFCNLNNIPSSGSNSELVWVPADGRDVSGSIYGNKVHNVPDLRGTFLRGLNVFDPVSNPPVRRPEQLDPENRTVDNLQKQDVQPHAHNITDPGHIHHFDRGGTINSWGSRVVPSGQTAGMDHINEPLKTSIDYTNIHNTQNSIGVETRPINIAVYYYIKIN